MDGRQDARHITIYAPQDFAGMRAAGRLAAETLDMVTGLVVPGVTTEELDRMGSPWVKYSGWANTFRSLKISAFAGVSAYAGAWMLVVASAFCWYFLLDRLRDISQAVKGR